MAEIIMQKGQVLSLKVTSIVENRKSFPKDNDTYYIHDIYVEDRHGNKSRKEFRTRTMTIPINTFVVGVYQNIRCVWPSEKGDEIEPYDGEAKTQPAPPVQSSLPKPTADIPNHNQDPPVAQHAINTDANVGGRAIVFAMAYAKDLKAAEIANRKAGSKVTTEDIEEMIAWGKQIRMGMLDFDAY